LDTIVSILLIIIGVINFVPVAGVLGGKALESAYNIDLKSAELTLLMQHRALLFGVLGGFILYSVFDPVYQTVAIVMAAVSMTGFAVLVLFAGELNSAIKKVLAMDYLGLVLLAAAILLRYL